MARVAGRSVSALLLTCAGLVFCNCASDKQPVEQAEQLAEEATQRVCDVFETCCVTANFQYQEQGCKAIFGPKIRAHFLNQTFLGADLNFDGAQRCLNAIGQASDGCRVDRDRYLTDTCNGLFTGTVPLGGECDPRHGCATTATAPLTCQRHYDDTHGFDYSGVCVAVVPRVVHNGLGQMCNQTCAADSGRCILMGSAGDTGLVEGTCFASDGLFCDTQAKRCAQRSVSGEPCLGKGYLACATGTYCDSAADECVPVRAVGESCTASEQCGQDHGCGNAGVCEGAGPVASATLCAGQLTTPSGPPQQMSGG